jgi:RNA polymerase sigma-70 factor (ECF subfamily)
MAVDTLVVRAQAGERQALAQLVETYQSQVYSLSMAIVRNPADAADMTQETFVRLLRSIGTYRGQVATFRTWLHRLTVNVCLDALRRKHRTQVSLDDQFDVASNDHWDEPAWRAEWNESASEVRSALEELPLPQRLALTLHYFEGSSYEQIAAVMALPINTVKSHMLRGKRRMARLLRRSGVPEPVVNVRLSFVAA